MKGKSSMLKQRNVEKNVDKDVNVEKFPPLNKVGDKEKRLAKEKYEAGLEDGKKMVSVKDIKYPETKPYVPESSSSVGKPHFKDFVNKDGK